MFKLNKPLRIWLIKKNAKILIKNLGFPLIGVVLFLGAWSIVAAIYNRPFTLPGPIETLRSAAALMLTGRFYIAFLNTLLRSVLAFLISFTLALLIALFCAVFDTRTIFSPIIAVVRSVPTMVVISLFLLWTQSASVTPILVAVLVIFPTCYSSFTAGIDKVERNTLESARVYGASRLELIRFVYLPSLYGNLLENTASGLSLTIKLIISAEFMVLTRSSMGAMIYEYRVWLNTAAVMAAALLAALFCIVFEYAVRAFIPRSLSRP